MKKAVEKVGNSRKRVEKRLHRCCGASDVTFLLDPFSTWHDEWCDKTAGGFIGFTAMTVRANGAETRCFAIQTADGDLIDISFPHAERRIKTARTAP